MSTISTNNSAAVNYCANRPSQDSTNVTDSAKLTDEMSNASNPPQVPGWGGDSSFEGGDIQRDARALLGTACLSIPAPQPNLELQQRTTEIVQEAEAIQDGAAVPGGDFATGLGGIAGALSDPVGTVTGALLEPGKEEALRATAEHAASGGHPYDGPEVYTNEWARNNPVVRLMDYFAHVGQPDTGTEEGMREYLENTGHDQGYIDDFMENEYQQ